MNRLTLLLVAVIFFCLANDANAFTCTEKGLFANTASNDCKTFYSCGSDLTAQLYSCYENTYFWPEKVGCFSEYDCDTHSIPGNTTIFSFGNTNPCEGLNYKGIPDGRSTDCTNYFECRQQHLYHYNGETNFAPVVLSAQCPSGESFKPGYGCASTNNEQCTTYQCTSEGNFENPDDCSKFIQCWVQYFETNTGITSRLYASSFTCPPNTKFNPFLKKCDEFYNCDRIDPYGGTDPCTEYNFANPLVPNPFDSDCSSYLVCQNRFEVIIKNECPANTYFSPLLGKCYENYDPNENCSKDPCSSGPGKYVDYNSGHCQSYIECRDETNIFELYAPTYEIRYCPPGERYSPESKNCSRSYVCPTFPVNYCYPQIPTTTTTTTTTTTRVPTT